MMDVFIAPKLWLPNIPDFNDMDYRIWAVIREWVCQQPVRDMDELRRMAMSDWHLVKHSADSHWSNDWQWRFRLRAWVRARSRQFEHCCTALLVHMFSHWMFETIMMTFKLTWRNWRRLYDICTYAAFDKALRKYPSREIDDFDVILFQIYQI